MSRNICYSNLTKLVKLKETYEQGNHNKIYQISYLILNGNKFMLPGKVYVDNEFAAYWLETYESDYVDKTTLDVNYPVLIGDFYRAMKSLEKKYNLEQHYTECENLNTRKQGSFMSWFKIIFS